MLRCAACGATVSEWASRCPSCRHDAVDAVRVPDPPASRRRAGPHPGVPPSGTLRAGLHPAPRRRPPLTYLGRPFPGWLPSVALMVGVLVAAAVVLVGTPLGRSPQQVLASTTAGTLVAARPDGSHQAAVAAPQGGLVVAPDGLYLATPDGREWVWRGHRLVPTGRRAPLGSAIDGPARLGHFTPLWQAIGFADHNRALVAVQDGGNGLLDAEVVGFGGRRFPVGPVAMAAGDPGALGAVTVTGSPQTVTLVDAGHRPRVLLTAAQANRLVGLPMAVGVALVALPDRSGDRVAVLAVPLAPVHNMPFWPSGIVVVNRSGRVMGVRRRATLGLPAWSPGGTTLIYPIPEVGHRDGVALWRVGATTAKVLRYSHPGPPLTGCVWATSGGAFLCSASEPSAGVPWVTGRLSGARLHGGSGPPSPLLFRT